MLAHLDTVLIVDVTQDYTVSESRLVKENRGNREQRIEPSSCLIDRLGYEIRREVLFKEFFVLKRIVILRERHRPRVEPTVDNLFHPGHLTSALTASAMQSVDIRAVKFDVAFDSAGVFEFFFRAHHSDFAAVFADPYRQRRTPVSFA